MKPFDADKGLRKLKHKQHIGTYIKYGTFVVSLLLFVATVIYLTRATFTSRHDFEIINAKVGEFSLNMDITLNLNGGSIEGDSIIHARRKQAIGTLPSPTKEGYNFVGWYFTPTFDDGTGVRSDTIVTRSMTNLYANYTKGVYELSVDLDGGTYAGEATYQVEYQSTQELVEPTKLGHTFNGWKITTGADKETSVSGNVVTMGTEASTVKANWIKNNYTLTLALDGGTIEGENPMSVPYDDEVTIPTPNKKGHTFTGWTNIEKLVGGRMPAEDVTLTANYTANTYKWIVYHEQGNIGNTTYSLVQADTSRGEAVYGTTYPSTDIRKSYDGFTAPDPYPTGTIDEDKKPEDAEDPTKNVLHYHYERNQYQLTVDLNGGTSGTQSQQLYYEEPLSLSATRTGYDLNASTPWSVTSGNASISSSTLTMGTSVSSVQANWTAKTIAVTYNSCSENAIPEANRTKYVKYDSVYGKDASGNASVLLTPTREGYDFAGWYLGTSCSDGTRIYDSTDVTTATNHTIYAHWTPKTYTVTLDRQSGSGGTSSVTATYDAAMPSATAPTRSGYDFKGYYTSTGGGGTQYYTNTMGSSRAWDKTSATTLYANWCYTNVNGACCTSSNGCQTNGTYNCAGTCTGQTACSSNKGQSCCAYSLCSTNGTYNCAGSCTGSVGYSGYRYWRSTTTYSSTSAPSTTYSNYTSLVTSGTTSTLIRTTYNNGNPTVHAACLYYGDTNKILCLDYNYWASNGSSTTRVSSALTTAMSNAYGVASSSLNCSTDLSWSTNCYIGRNNNEGGFVIMNDKTVDSRVYPWNHDCYIKTDGSAYCK